MSDLSGAFRLRSVTPATVEVDFGAGPQQMTVLNLMGRVPTGGPVDFTALDAFPQSGNILWSGADRGLGEALRTRPRIRFLLEELRLDFDDPPGTLDDPHMLAACSRLRTISLGHAYALGPDDLPDLPELCRLELHGIRRSVARALRDRYRGSGVQVYVQGDVSDAWPARHLDNPFREWAEASEAAAEEAGSADARALAAAEGVTPSAPDRLRRAERALRRFVTDFNGMDQRYGVIDTAEREQVWAAYAGLAARFHVPLDEEPSEWFDDGRKF